MNLALAANAFTNPLSWVMLMMVMGCWALWRSRSGQAWAWMLSATLLLISLGWMWPANQALLTLENRYPPLTQIPPQISGVIILGGATNEGRQTGLAGAMPFNQAAERMVHPLILIRHHPEWTIVLTGAQTKHLARDAASHQSEAIQARELWRKLGFSVDKVLTESESTNTVENAQFSARLPHVNPRAGWLLVTSSWHMARAMAIFEQQGWKVYPWPVDYEADEGVQWKEYSITHGPRIWQMVIHEHMGLWGLQLQNWGWVRLSRS